MGRTVHPHKQPLDVWIFPAEELDVMLILEKKGKSPAVFSSGDVAWLGLNLRMALADRGYYNMRINVMGTLNVGVKRGDVYGWIKLRDNVGNYLFISEEQADYVCRKIERALAHGKWREPPREKRR